MPKFKLAFALDDEFAKRNRPHTKQERDDLEEMIVAEGCKPGALTVALIGDEAILCDGYTTRAICEANKIKTTKPRSIRFKNRDAALVWIDRQQRGRRNLTPDEMAERKAERVERVVEARADGKSIRDIAEDEGVSPATIQNDLKNAPPSVHPCTHETPDSKNTETILCTHCATLKRKGQKPTKSCDDCKKARAAAKLKVEVDESVAEEEEEAPEPTIDDEIKAKNSEIEKFARKLTSMIEDMPDDPWLDRDNRKAGIIQKIKDACAALRTCKCHAACPMCKGDRCAKCLKTGRVTKYQYDQLAG